MFEIPENILDFFFKTIKKLGKYEIELNANGALIKPCLSEEYYKPIIIVKDLTELEASLIHYVETLNEFFLNNNNLEKYHDLEFFLYILLFSMTSTDALDLTRYINKRSYFFQNNHFKEYDEPQIIAIIDNIKFYVKRELERPGLETPYKLIFSMEINGKVHQLPLVRYAFDENNVCHLFSVQFGQLREFDVQDAEYKQVINQINSGVKKYRNVSPSFVLTFALFLKILQEYGINKIVVPDYLFCKYKNYYRAKSIIRSDAILSRILDNFITLLERMEYQFPQFEIKSYPNDIDSFTHITLNNSSNDNIIFKREIKK